jgi:hypothetical protein
MHLFFVSTRRGSYFMTELLAAISGAVAAAGHTTELVFDRFPPLRGESAYVAIPHEFHAWGDPGGFPDRRQRARTIALCTENPGTEWFEATYRLLPQFAAAASINRSSAAELGRRGIRCEHIQLGYVPLWDTWQRDESENVQRPIDVLYMGAADPRRDPLLAGIGGELWARECQFLVPPLEPRTAPRPDFLTGTDKYARLRSAKILLNLHRTTSSALEWMRFLEAICNGCVVVSEPCLDNDPLLPGEHFLSVRAEDIACVIDRLLDDPRGIRRLRQDSYDFVRQDLPMAPAAQRLAELAHELPRLPRAPRKSPYLPDRHALALHRPSSPPEAFSQVAGPVEETAPCRSANGIALQPSRARRLRRGIFKRLPGHSGLRVIADSGDRSISPLVSVLLVLADDRQPGPPAGLASLASSSFNELEVLILSNGSGDSGYVSCSGFLEGHAGLSAVFLRQQVQECLGRSRNALVECARGEFVFILDPLAAIYPSTLERLVTALGTDPRAVFSYPMTAIFDHDEPVELLGSMPWEPKRLTRGNWIDGMALIRRRSLQELGGYSTDPRLAGWEDFDLWCNVAEAGGHAVHVPQVLGRRQRAANPPPVQLEGQAPERWTLLRERFPRLFSCSPPA